MLFFDVKSPCEARALLQRPTPALSAERVNLSAGLERVLAVEARSPIELPEFDRSVVDGYAVRAASTFGAGPGAPAYLEVVGEVPMGKPATVPVGPGEAVKVATGGMLPPGADAMVMIEYAEAVGDGSGLIEIVRAAAPGDLLVRRGDDLSRGALIVPAGRRLRPQDLGALAGVGLTEVQVYRLPRVAVIPTGDEIVPPEQVTQPGEVRDMNSVCLTAAVEATHAEARRYPIVRDDPEALRETLRAAVEATDLVLIAGGSSVGTRDWTLDVLMELPGAELLLHGVSIRPGKPVILVAAGERLLVGLPGNPVSALMVFQQFIAPYVRRLGGETTALPTRPQVRARLAVAVSSDPGKEDYLRVRLRASDDGGDGYVAEPLLGKSALIMTMVAGDGIVVIPENVEGLEAGVEVDVLLF